MKLVLLFVILVSSPFAFSQTEAQIRVLDNKVKSFFKTTNQSDKECQQAEALFSVLSNIVVRDLGNGDYDITGSNDVRPHVWIQLRSSDHSCKYENFKTGIRLSYYFTNTYVQTNVKKPVRTLDEDVKHFFEKANKPRNKTKECLEAAEIYKNPLKDIKIRDLGGDNFFITGKTTKNDLLGLELAYYSNTYDCSVTHPRDPISIGSSSREVCGWETVCGSGYYSGQCANSWVCRRY